MFFYSEIRTGFFLSTFLITEDTIVGCTMSEWPKSLSLLVLFLPCKTLNLCYKTWEKNREVETWTVFVALHLSLN